MAKIMKLSKGPFNHFFGYYGINAWDKKGRYHLALETDFHERRPVRKDVAKVGLVDSQTGEFKAYAETSAFNLQQGSMLHFINVGFGEEMTYNAWEGDSLMSYSLNYKSGIKRTINGAIAGVHPNGKKAVGLSFDRMFHCRKVVGYANDIKSYERYPKNDGIFELDLVTGEKSLVLPISEIIAMSGSELINEGMCWFNHLIFNKDGSKIAFLARIKSNKVSNGFIDSMWTVNSDGTNPKMQIDYGNRISHFLWLDNEKILVSSNVIGEKLQFIEFTDGQKDFTSFGGNNLPDDGHAAFSPDGRWLVCDSYPNKDTRFSELMFYNSVKDEKVTLGQFHHEEIFTGDVRCDLHPRWAKNGLAVTFDSVHEGDRQIYVADVTDIVVN